MGNKTNNAIEEELAIAKLKRLKIINNSAGFRAAFLIDSMVAAINSRIPPGPEDFGKATAIMGRSPFNDDEIKFIASKIVSIINGYDINPISEKDYDSLTYYKSNKLAGVNGSVVPHFAMAPDPYDPAKDEIDLSRRLKDRVGEINHLVKEADRFGVNVSFMQEWLGCKNKPLHIDISKTQKL